MTILPIVTPNINFKEFLINSKELFGYSFGDKLDKNGVTIGDYNSYMLMLEEFETSSQILQEFLSFSIMIMELQTSLFAILRQRAIHVLLKETKRVGYFLCYCTGTLKQWKEFIVFCTQSDIHDIRVTGKELHQYFEKLGLFPAFREYKKIEYNDQTYRLTKQ